MSCRPSIGPRAAVLLALWLGLSIGCSPTEARETTKIGLLLPYTGSSSALAANMEKGAIFAVKLMNDVASEEDLPFEIVFANTAGSPELAAKAAQSLVDEGVVAVVGPGGDEVVSAAHEVLAEHGIPLISPLASTTIDGIGTSAEPWLRLSSSTSILGASLANVVSGADVQSAGLVVATDDYHSGLGEAFREQFTGVLGGELDVEISIRESSFDTTSVANEIREAFDAGTDSFVLAMHPLPAARLLTEVRSILSASDVGPSWFLTPRLKTEILVVNSSAAAVENAVGVSSAIAREKTEAFSSAFDEEFGVAPLEPTFFVFDASLALLLAIDQRAQQGGDAPADLVSGVVEVTDFGGIVFDWTDLARAKGLYREGRTGQLIGLTGAIDFFDTGERKIGTTNIWEFQDGAIINIE